MEILLYLFNFSEDVVKLTINLFIILVFIQISCKTHKN
jgi:hypothetical protein